MFLRNETIFLPNAPLGTEKKLTLHTYGNLYCYYFPSLSFNYHKLL